MSDKKTVVMVTAVGGGGHGEQILKALTLAAPGRYHVIAADASAYQPQFEMADDHVQLPMASDPDYLDRLLDVCRQYHVDALFHGCEPELKVFSDNINRLREAGLFVPINDPALIKTCMDKAATLEALQQHGFQTPQHKILRSLEDAQDIDFWPVVVKPYVGSGGSSHVYIAQTKAQLEGLIQYMGQEMLQFGFVVQEYVGTADDEYTVGVLHGMDGAFINSIAVKRDLNSTMNVSVKVPNITERTDLGQTLVISSGISQGRIGHFTEVRRQCEALATALGSTGPLNIQCRFVNGKVQVFEINPRYSGTTSLRAMVGFNEPDIMIRRHLLSETIAPHFQYENAYIVRNLQETKLPILDQ